MPFFFFINTNVKFDSFSNKIENNFYQDYYTSYIINSRSDWENTINDFKEYKSILLIEELLEKVYKYINSLNPDFRPDGDLLDITNIETINIFVNVLIFLSYPKTDPIPEGGVVGWSKGGFGGGKKGQR